MKFSEQWLRLWVNPDASIQEIADRMTMAGLEIAGFWPAAERFSQVIVGVIKKLTVHPEHNHLQVVTLEVGQSKELTVVCGAENIAQGDKVPVALVGAQLPNQQVVKQRQFNEVTSQGMLCSAAELSLSDESEGVFIFDSNAPLGIDCFDYFQLDDHIVEVELTPNRGDCLSIQGLARELGVLFTLPVQAVQAEEIIPSIDECVAVEIKAAEGCPHYLGRVIRNINPTAATPVWMQERLRRSGLRAILPVVDVMNYVMLELGQPMHAFDLAKINGRITVRWAEADEPLVLLDESEVSLKANTLVIADENQVLAMAGIMGGLDSAVTTNTQDIFLESAFFTPLAIAGKARQYGMATDASHRFERGVDSQLPLKALERASELLLSIVGGEAGPIETTQSNQKAQPQLVCCRRSRLDSLLGIQIEDKTVLTIFTHLGLQPEIIDSGWQVTVPSYRFDIAIEEDLIEEVGRIYGYANINNDATAIPNTLAATSGQELSLDTLAQALVHWGYQEVISYSFVDSALQEMLEPEQQALSLLNPISSEMNVMRTTLWTGLLSSLQRNQSRQEETVRLFETGLCFLPGECLVQQCRIAGLINGLAKPTHWDNKARAVDFYDLKGSVEALLALTAMPERFHFERSSHPALHPGQSAAIYQDKQPIGYLGTLHPQVAQAFGLKGETVLFELNYAALDRAALPSYEPLSKYPSIKRDLAVIVDEAISAQAIEALVWAQNSDLLQQIEIFDIYRGEGIEKGKKSIALGLTLQHQSRTLIDIEVNTFMDEVVEILKTNLSATMRE